MNLSDIKFITSVMAYEFQIDAIRLTTISTPPFIDAIQKQFNFQSVEITTPPPIFGDVPVTFPPGLVFSMGVFPSQEEGIVPIRFLNFELRRIIVSVADNSVNAQRILIQTAQLLQGHVVSDGSDVLGAPVRELHYTEIVARFPFSVEKIFQPQALRVMANVFHAEKGKAVSPTIYLALESELESGGAVINPSARVLQISRRATTHAEDNIYFSGAPLRSEEHVSYLERLVSIMEDFD